MGLPAIFLDRDGTLIEDCGILRDPRDIVFFDDTVPALRILAESFKFFIVTHQAEIGRGNLKQVEADAVNRAIVEHLAQNGITISDVYCCPHPREDNCGCIKPNPAFMLQAAETYDLDLAASWSVGDHPHDAEMGARAGGQGVYLLTGHGYRHRAEVPSGIPIMPSLQTAAIWIHAAHFAQWRNPDSRRAAAEAGALIRSGELAVFPTETVYGLGANALDKHAVARIFEVKNRPDFDPLIVHIADPDQLKEIVATIPDEAVRLANTFWPGPLTLVLPKRDIVPALVTAGLPSVAVRIPCHPVALELIRNAGVPVAAPSANRFGGISPTTVTAARVELGGLVKNFVDGGPCVMGIESTVISLLGQMPRLLRPGALTLEDIEKVIGPVKVGGGDCRASPGQLLRHYAPGKLVRLWSPSGPLPSNAARAALLALFPTPLAESFAHSSILAPSGDLRAAAANLFGELRRLDQTDAACIYACPAPEHGLGRAINDRLRRASTKQE